jgi:hypothetical protein
MSCFFSNEISHLPGHEQLTCGVQNHSTKVKRTYCMKPTGHFIVFQAKRRLRHGILKHHRVSSGLAGGAAHRNPGSNILLPLLGRPQIFHAPGCAVLALRQDPPCRQVVRYEHQIGTSFTVSKNHLRRTKVRRATTDISVLQLEVRAGRLSLEQSPSGSCSVLLKTSFLLV